MSIQSYPNIFQMSLIENWKFLCYRNASGKNQISTHLARLSKSGMMKLRRTLEHLQVKPQTSWSRPQASPTGNNIYVIHFTDENRTQHRLFGHHEIIFQEFVITLYGVEKDGKYDPANYASICADRQCECLAEPAKHKCSCLARFDTLFPDGQTLPSKKPRVDARPGKSPSLHGRQR